MLQESPEPSLQPIRNLGSPDHSEENRDVVQDFEKNRTNISSKTNKDVKYDERTIRFRSVFAWQTPLIANGENASPSANLAQTP